MQYEVTAISQRVYKHGLDSNLSDSVFINYTQFTLSAVFVEEKNKRKSSLSPLCKTDPTKIFFQIFWKQEWFFTFICNYMYMYIESSMDLDEMGDLSFTFFFIMLHHIVHGHTDWWCCGSIFIINFFYDGYHIKILLIINNHVWISHCTRNILIIDSLWPMKHESHLPGINKWWLASGHVSREFNFARRV